ncbi:MAG: DMT family transporter [Thermoflexibacteraceae bacterium]
MRILLMTNWLLLALASCLEVCWVFSVKFLDVKKIWKIDWKNFFADNQGIITLAPLIGYIFFGVTNIVLFSMAIKKIPASTAFAVWMSLALVGTKAVELIGFKYQFSWANLFFVLLILIGIIGLKSTTAE